MWQDFYLKIMLVDKENAKLPTQANESDAGYDVYSPIDTVIYSMGDAKIPLGWACEFPAGFCLDFKNKSGRALNDKLIVGAKLIDSGYRGIVHCHLFNLGLKPIYITKGEKISQFIVTPVWNGQIEQTVSLSDSERGEGGFGSSGLM